VTAQDDVDPTARRPSVPGPQAISEGTAVGRAGRRYGASAIQTLLWRPSALPAVALFVVTLIQRPAHKFIYDAGNYWSGSTALFTHESVYDLGLLGLRGVLTTVVYAPAALLERLVPGSGPVAVLVENAAILALLGAVALPAIVRGLGANGALVRWACVGLVWLVAARFAPYPLMDIPAATLFFCAVALVVNWTGRWRLLAAGICAGVAVNIRPAYLVAAAALAVGVIALRGWRAPMFALGVALGLLPQVGFNLTRGSGLSLTPVESADLVALQASYAAFTIRYDTVVDGLPPQQFYCDRAMAAASAATPVDSTLGLVKALLTGMPESLGLLLKKLGAALAWSSTTPYNLHAGSERYDLALPIILITVTGIAGLLVTARRSRSIATLLVIGIAAAACLSLFMSATEARFALPLVLAGVVGCARIAPAVVERWGRGRPTGRRHALPEVSSDAADWAPNLRWLIWVAGGTVLVLIAAVWGLSDAVPAGPATPASCAVAR
jgi:hypothetical protein